jgi:hypothetical protein
MMQLAMRRICFLGLVPLVVIVAIMAVAPAADSEVVFISATDCQGAHGVYRWDFKTDHEVPPETIPAANKVKPSDIGNWPPPRGQITKQTPRSGREKEWYEVTGKVTLVKAEEDGDLHIQLQDADGPSNVNVVVEVPVRQTSGESPWDTIRTDVFGWTDQTFPFQITSSKKLTLTKHPVIRVEGKAFFDATHAGKGSGAVPNRRKDVPGEEVTVWEIHPVMVLTVVSN